MQRPLSFALLFPALLLAIRALAQGGPPSQTVVGPTATSRGSAVPASRADADYPPNMNPFAATSRYHGPAGYRVPDGLAAGAAFIDRILPMPAGTIRDDVWGASMTGPRNVDNGLEDPAWSYWCMSIHRNPETGKYDMICSRWPENAAKGHMSWPSSTVVYAVADRPTGPYRTVGGDLGRGHNAWTYQAKDGRWVQSFNGGGRIAHKLSGPWEDLEIAYDDRGTPSGPMTNHTFTRREDGSILMLSRGGRVWISRDGIEPFRKITHASPYPQFQGRFEDPCVWRDDVQYNLIVNDWFGRQAYYLRSRDGVNWILDAGLAYLPTSARHLDGTVERWFKFERPNVIQDQYGRATHLSIAAIDTLKNLDQPNDDHSSKILILPLRVPRRVEIMPARGDTWRVRVKAEDGFQPVEDLDVASLRFGLPEDVDLGRGASARQASPDGQDLVLSFPRALIRPAPRDFVCKLLGKTRSGDPAFGFARLPDVDFHPALLSLEPPKLTGGTKVVVPVENSGLSASRPTSLALRWNGGGQTGETRADVPALQPYERCEVAIQLPAVPAKGGVLEAVLPAANGCTGETRTAW